MQLYLRYLIFIGSLIILSLYIFINYKIGKKEGIKRALYRITYRSLCVIFAFILAPYLTEYILNFNLYKYGYSIRYNGMHFYRIIDFIEEVIVHNEVLTDIYNFIPSLKNLLMDFPQLLFVPFGYVISFLLVSLLLLPVYFYLVYRRRRRVLYDAQYNNKSHVWAGILTAVQSVFLISIVLTPISGLSRIYKESTKGLIEDDSNICRQNQYLAKYDFACQIIEGYNSSVIGLIGESPLNDYINDSLTRITLENEETSLNEEIVSIARAGVVLNKTGLLNVVNVKNFEDVSALDFNGLTDEDVEVIVKAFEQSVYTKEVVNEVYEWSKSYLDWLLKDLVDEDFYNNYQYDDIIRELKIILNAINYILNNQNVLETVKDVYKIIDEFLEEYKKLEDVEKGLQLFLSIIYEVDIDALIEIYGYLRHSKIYNDFIPRVLDHLLAPVGINVNLTANPEELNEFVMRVFDLSRTIQSHRYIYNILHLLSEFTLEEVHKLASLVEFASNSNGMKYLIYDAANLGIEFLQLKLDIPTEILLEIKEWDRELELAQRVIQIVYTYKSENYIDYDNILDSILTYHDTVLFGTFIKYLVNMLPDIVKTWIAGKDIDYLVGEYVEI